LQRREVGHRPSPNRESGLVRDYETRYGELPPMNWQGGF